MAQNDMTGLRFGKLLVIEPAGSGNYGTYWLCACDCGNKKIIRGWSLRHGGVKSCGCETKSIKHGFCRGEKPDRLYNIWRDMRSRCSNPKNIGFNLYGGRGISVCPQWRTFKPFSEWAMQNGYQPDLTLDRIDVNGNYCPENCRWLSLNEQQKNKRVNIYVTASGRTQCIADWAKELQIKPSVLYKMNYSGKDLAAFIENVLQNSSGHAGESEYSRSVMELAGKWEEKLT